MIRSPNFCPSIYMRFKCFYLFVGVRHIFTSTYTLCCHTTVDGSRAEILVTDITGRVLAAVLVCRRRVVIKVCVSVWCGRLKPLCE
jgi:hypothetical protein